MPYPNLMKKQNAAHSLSFTIGDESSNAINVAIQAKADRKAGLLEAIEPEEQKTGKRMSPTNVRYKEYTEAGKRV